MGLKLTIQKKLISLFLILSLVPLAVVSILAYKNSQSTIKQNIGSKFEELASHTIDETDKLLFFRKEDIKAWAATDVMQNVRTNDKDGRIIRTLSRLKRDYGVYSGIFCINTRGKIIASSELKKPGEDVSGEPWFKEVLNTPDVYISDLEYDNIINGFSVNFTVPIFASDDEAQVIGFLSSYFNWSELFMITNAIQVNEEGQSESGYTLLINNKGGVISGPGFILAEEAEERELSKRNLLSSGYKSAQLGIKGEKGFLVETSHSGSECLIGYAGSQGYRDFEGLGWTLLIMQDTKEAFMPVVKLRNQFVVIGLGVGFSVLILAIFVSRGIGIPIRKLAITANKIAEGDLSYRAEVKSKDEIGVLAGSFDTMRLNLVELLRNNKEARQDWESTFNSVKDIIIIYDKDCTLIRCNNMLLSRLNVKLEEIVGRKCHEVFSQDKSNYSHKCSIVETSKILKPVTIESEEPHLGGIFNIAAFPRFDNKGDYIGVVQVLRNITERKKAEESIRKLSHAIEQSSASVVITDTKGSIEYVNPKFTTLTGYSAEEAIGKNPRVLKSGKTPREVYKELWETITSGNEWRGELCNRKKDGGFYWESASISPVKDDKGVITNFIAVKEDITDRRQADEKLQQSEKRLANAQKLVHMGYWNWDIVKNELSWSDEVYRIFGMKPQEFGKTRESFFSSVHIDDREFVQKTMDDALSSDKLYKIDYRIVLPDGSERIVNEQVEIIYDSEGKAIQMNGTIQDITERKLIEEGLWTRERQQAAISELGMHALEDPDINTLLNETVSITALALGVQYCGLLELLPDGKALLLKAGVGWKTGSVGYVTVGTDTDSQAGYTLHSNEPVIVGDIRTETRFSTPSLLLEHKVVSGMSVILKGKDRPFGVIGVHTTRQRTFTVDDVNFLLSVSNVVADAIERKRLSAHIDHVAQYDILTDLPNRILFIDRVTRTISRAKREKEQIAVLYLNLDRFKAINDSMGNETGDRLLKSVAERMVNCVREGDTVSRMGGDEFAIMLVGITSVPDVTKVSQKIIKAVSKPLVLDGREMHITASIGISMYPQDDEKMEGLIKKASTAMLQAKEQGRNNDRFYNTEMETSSYEMMMLENDLRKALDRKEFLLCYQPQVDINTGRIIGVEALVRWRHPDRGMVSPAEFIPIAEETGLIIPIGEWVLHTALAQNKAWQEDGLAPVNMSVNFSAVQFRQKDPVELVANALRETGLNPGYMGLEITESVIMKGADVVIKKFHELKELGIHICMDDFGTGYSSLSYLKRFPIDILKIDQSFARNVTTDTSDASIVTATIAMAHGLGLKVIAEGVETKEQLEFFRSLKCEIMQGYFFSKPLPTEDVTKLLREGGRFEI